VLLEHEIEAVSDQFLHCRVLLGSKHAQLLRALGREEAAWFKAGLHMELGEAGLTLPGWTMAP